MKNPTREKFQNKVWTHTHRDYRGKFEDGTKTILVYRQGTTLVPISALTDKEIADRLPADLKPVFAEFIKEK